MDDLHDLDDASKAKARGLYDQALQEMKKAKASAVRIASFDLRAAEAPEELARTKAALAELPAEARVTVPSDVSLPQIEQAITQRGTGLEAWRRELANVETDLKGRASRRGEIPTQISAVQQILADVNNELQSPAPAQEASPVNSARRLMLLAKRCGPRRSC